MPGILDTVLSSQQSEQLRNFNPKAEVLEYLRGLETRESQILGSRYGLAPDGIRRTLEEIGGQLGLTRERVRQVEKNALKKLSAKPLPPALQKSADLVFQLIEDRGNIIREETLQGLLGQDSLAAKNSLLFILYLVPRFNLLKETPALHQCWHLPGLDRELFDEVIAAARQILEESGQTLAATELFSRIRTRLANPEVAALSDSALETMAGASKLIDHNPFGQWGLANSPAIRPGDVGDKAYLVLEHHEKPEHYSVITDLINKQLAPGRAAHKETVHNELIKDSRFVLVGRGIYALAKWGYKKGVVADVIDEVLRAAAHPLSREEIIESVLKQRFVKRNTIIVGLSNRKRFQKEGSKYTSLTNVQ